MAVLSNAFLYYALDQTAHRDEGTEAGKGVLGFDFFVRNPNHTGEAKPGTILKGKRERRKESVGSKVAVKTQTTPIPSDTHIFLEAAEIRRDRIMQGSISRNAYP